MENIALLFVCLAIGMALRKFNRVPDNAHTTLNAFIINIALPALIFQQIHNLKLDPTMVFAVLMPWLLFAASAALFWAIGRQLNLQPATTGALAVVGGLGNTSFIGLPMNESFYGASGMPTGILIDQLGTYLVLSTVGIVLISVYADGAVTRADIAKRILTFPPLIALVVALALIPVSYPPLLTSVLARLGATVAPLALVSVGLQLRLGELSGNLRLLAMGLGYKLVLAPLIILALYAEMIGLRGPTTEVTMLEAAMPPMLGGSIVAIQYGLNPKLISLMVGVGTVAAFLTLPAWTRAFAFF
jgi:predicted permease